MNQERQKLSELREEDNLHRRRIECQTNQITSSVTDNLMVVDVWGVGGQDREEGKKKSTVALQMEGWR